MKWRRAGGHLIIWGLAAWGVWLAFSFFPEGFVLPRNNLMSLLIVPAIIYWLTRSLSLFWVRRHATAHGAFQINELAQKEDYGMISHPLCVADVLVAWGIFFYYPDIRVLVSVIWMTLVMAFWLRLERNAITGTDKDFKKEDDLAP